MVFQYFFALFLPAFSAIFPFADAVSSSAPTPEDQGAACVRPAFEGSRITKGLGLQSISHTLVADFNRDGRLDVVNNSGAFQVLTIQLGIGNGYFGEPVVIDPSVIGSYVVAADFNNDGNPDLVTPTKIFLGTGTGTFLAARALGVAVNASFFKIGDFNGDDNMDFAGSPGSTSTIEVYFGDGTGRFAPATIVNFVSGSVDSFVAVDFNTDGVSDLVTTLTNNSVAIALGSPSGVFGTPTAFPVGGTGTASRLAVGDVDGDLDLDVVTSNVEFFSDTKITTLINNGSGTLTPQPQFLESSSNLVRIALEDVNGDNKLDLLATNTSGVLVRRFGNNDGTFQTSRRLPGIPGQVEMFFEDFTGDGIRDLGVNGTGVGSPMFAVIVNDPNGNLGPEQIDIGGDVGPIGMAQADFNEDGKTDVVVANELNSFWVGFGNGTGGFVTPLTIPSNKEPRVVLTADVNNDGNQDIFSIVQNDNEQFGQSWVALGNGNGTFQAPVQSAVANAGRMPALLDLDRDGVLDLAIPSISNNRLQLLKGFGNGAFAFQTVIDFTFAPRSMTAGDFDQDGFMDLAALSGSVYVYLNNGTFQPTAIGTFPTGNTNLNSSHIISADFNGDNLPDIVSNTDTIGGGIGNPGKAYVMLGVGKGGFGVPTEYVVGRGASQMVTADFDGDGNRDIAMANSGYNLGSAADTRVTVMYGNGLGGFPRIQDVAAANFPKGIGAMDLDMDGDIDIVTPDWGQSRVTLLKNICLNTPPVLPQLNAGADVQVTEGDGSNVTVNLTVTLSAPSAIAVRTRYYTAPFAGVPGIQEGEFLKPAEDDLTTTGGQDYAPANGTLQFAPGETSKTVQFTVRGDLIDEFDEYVGFYLADPINASINDNSTMIRIIDNDGPPVISIGNLSSNEGNSGDTVFGVPVSVSTLSEKPITVIYATGGGTATPNADYRSAQAAFTLQAGRMGGFIPVSVIGDNTVEPDDTFGIQISEPVNATIGNPSATVTITNDDVGGSVQFSAGPFSGAETTGLIPVTITRTGGGGGGVSVRFRTQSGTATPGQDYVEQTTTVQFGDNEVSKTVNVEVLRDELDEPDETVNLLLDQPSGVTIGSPSTAILTILDLETPPNLTIADGQVLEGNSGTTTLKIFLNLSRPTQREVTVSYATADVTATAGTDYDAASGTFTMPPGVTHKALNIIIHGDTTFEFNETLQVNLSNAVNANLIDNQAIGTIVNDELSTATSLSFVSINQAGTGSANSDSLEPSLSANGKIIAFESFASNLAGTDTNGTRDIYVRDTEAGQTRLVSINAAGTNSGNCDSRKPLVSPNGRYVAFVSCASDLVPAPANIGGLDGFGVFLRDLQTNVTRPVSLTSTGTLASADPWAMSADGRYVVFQSNDQGVTSTPDSTNTSDIFVRDMVSNVTQLITINRAGTATGNGSSGNGFSDRDIRMTPDGRYVLFPSTATDLVNLPNVGASNSYVRDLSTQTTTAVSVNAAGTQLVGSGPGGSISDDGRYVFFVSLSNDVTPTDPNTASDAFRRDLQQGTTLLVSFNNTGTASGNAGSSYVRGSASGRYAAFISSASNLSTTNDSNSLPDIYWRDINSGQTRLVSVNAAGTNGGNQFSDFPKISADGQNVVFKSAASDLVPNVDNNSTFDQYLRQVDNGRTYIVSGNQGGTSAGNQPTIDSVMSTDGSVVSFASASSNLLPNDLNGLASDVFAFSVTEPDIDNSAPFDFDGDGKTDIGIFRPNGPASEWWINRSGDGQTLALQFGSSTDKIVPADYTGDGKADIAIFRPSSGEWYVLRSEDFSFFALPFGTNGDVPVPADYDADRKADFAVFRPSSSTWFISQSSGAPTRIVQFGTAGDAPVVSDYDGDGKADIGIFRQAGSGAEWWIDRSTAGSLAMQFGASTDKPVQGDYTGDGKADIAIWRPSTGEWLIVRSEDFSFYGFPFGANGDIVAPGDYDGDGKFDATVFRPSNATWFIGRSTAGTLIVQFGANGDRPIPNAFIP